MAQPKRTARDDEPLEGARILVVEGRFYDHINDELVAGARAVIEAAGARMDVVTMPGALEIPLAIAMAAEAALERGEPYDGAVALGCVIRGETTHYEIVSGESARALMDLGLDMALPIGQGILTVENEAQALARAERSQLNKGGDAAAACLALVRLRRRLDNLDG